MSFLALADQYQFHCKKQLLQDLKQTYDFSKTWSNVANFSSKAPAKCEPEYKIESHVLVEVQ